MSRAKIILEMALKTTSSNTEWQNTIENVPTVLNIEYMEIQNSVNLTEMNNIIQTFPETSKETVVYECIENPVCQSNNNLMEIENYELVQEEVIGNVQADVNQNLELNNMEDMEENVEDMSQNNRTEAEERDENEITTHITKKGEQRRRRKFKYSTEERKTIKHNKLKNLRFVRTGCGEECKKKCNTVINQGRRVDINSQFWNLDHEQQDHFMLSCISNTNVKRRTVGPESRRSCTLRYFLKNETGESKEVCRTFFLTTLGFHKNNDKILQRFCKYKKSLITPKSDGRRGKIPHNKLDHSMIEKHIVSFNPSISHYRREHAPNRRYLPSDLNIKDMFSDFKNKNPTFSCSYDLYRSIVQKLNISFVKLGHEECEMCEHFKIHPHSQENLQNDCADCKNWSIHIKKAEDARIKYKEHASKHPEQGEVIFSVDLEKVIMLPRCEMFKSVIFAQRLVAYNESFVPVGSKNKNIKAMAALWHEAIQGRKKEDIISAFYKFFLSQRDAKKIILWVDNCSSQNKNWAFFTFLVYIVNSSHISANVIDINYLEPGHTFMSADSFHHQVEKSLRKVKKVYDFTEFKHAVQQANSGKVDILEMELRDFYHWKDFSSAHKINRNHSERPYIYDMVQVQAQRGSMSLLYKKDFHGSQLPLNFLTAKVMKSGIPFPKSKENPRGITTERRDNIISKLLESENSIMPKNRLHFWKEIPITQSTEEDNDV